MSQVKGPLPVPLPLAEDDLLFYFGFSAGITRLQIQGQPNSVFGRVEHQVTILQGNAAKTERGDVFPGRGITVALRSFIQIEFHRVTVINAILQRLTEFPAIEILLSDSLVALRP